MTSPISNALGKIVLLGTPFYYKHWARWIRLKLTASIVVSFLLCYVITFAMCSFWLSLGQQDSFDVGVVAWVSAIVQLFLFTAHMLAWCERTLLRNGNMYHSDKVWTNLVFLISSLVEC
jgi:NADH:ubiquinone oxidoreductase subunit 6 (subunit J)